MGEYATAGLLGRRYGDPDLQRFTARPLSGPGASLVAAGGFGTLASWTLLGAHPAALLACAVTVVAGAFVTWLDQSRWIELDVAGLRWGNGLYRATLGWSQVLRAEPVALPFAGSWRHAAHVIVLRTQTGETKLDLRCFAARDRARIVALARLSLAHRWRAPA